MSGYAKLFASILDSTIWQEDKDTRLVWITMLAMKNAKQIVEASIPGLAKRAGVGVDECQASLKKLEAPDPFSRTKEFDGRRVEPVEGGWKVLNGDKYRKMLSLEQRREYQANWIRDKRAAKSPNTTAADRAHEQAIANGDTHTAQRLEKIQEGTPPTLSDELGGCE